MSTSDKIEMLVNSKGIPTPTQAFAVPGQDTLIDCVNPLTGRSAVYGNTLEEIRERYPSAEIVNIAEWCAAKGARQDSTVTWTETTEEQYWEMLEVLPPACMRGGGFLVGEPCDHHAVSGKPRFQAFIKHGGKHYAASRPMTRDEYLELLPKIKLPEEGLTPPVVP